MGSNPSTGTNFMKFALSAQSKNDHEGSTVAVYCALNKSEYRVYNKAKDVPKDCIPVGNVKWVEEVLGNPEKPDYYPDFLKDFLHRNIWEANEWPHTKNIFIKPSDRHKRFTGFVTKGGWKGKKKGPFWCSEIVNFTTEWRWYIAAGQVIDARYGSGVELPVPALDVEFPQDYYAAVDFGLLDNGKIALIESNSPFACGWYGPTGEGKTYVEWLAKSWEYLSNR